MAISGVLASMLRGAGNGTRENARKSIEEEERKQRELREDERYNERLAGERADRDAHYAKVRADQKEDLDASRAHDLELAKLRNKENKSNSRNNMLLANRVKSFETQGAKYLERIDEIATDSMLTEEQKIAAAAPLYARLDELVENNPEMYEFSPLFSSFHSSAKGFISQFAPPEPNPKQTEAASEKTSTFVPPARVQTEAVKVTNQHESEYLERSPQFIRDMGGVLNSMKANPGVSERTADLEQLKASGNVRPF